MLKLTKQLARIYEVITVGDSETIRLLSQSLAEFERMRQGRPLAE